MKLDITDLGEAPLALKRGDAAARRSCSLTAGGLGLMDDLWFWYLVGLGWVGLGCVGLRWVGLRWVGCGGSGNWWMWGVRGLYWSV